MYKKTLCLGGSFNPIHHGHLICARSVAQTIGASRILLIPSGQPPHKPGNSELAHGAHRLQMCGLAIDAAKNSSEPGFDVSDLEINRPGPSFTLDTVRELRRQGWPEVLWLIGADMLNYLPKWHEHAQLLREAEFIVMARPHVALEWESLPAEIANLKKNVVLAPLIDISATDIRRRVCQNESIDYLTPPAVVDYILRNNLYRDSGPRETGQPE